MVICTHLIKPGTFSSLILPVLCCLHFTLSLFVPFALRRRRQHRIIPRQTDYAERRRRNGGGGCAKFCALSLSPPLAIWVAPSSTTTSNSESLDQNCKFSLGLKAFRTPIWCTICQLIVHSIARLNRQGANGNYEVTLANLLRLILTIIFGCMLRWTEFSSLCVSSYSSLYQIICYVWKNSLPT